MTPFEIGIMMAIRIGLSLLVFVGALVAALNDGDLSRMGAIMAIFFLALYLVFRIRWAAMLRKRKRAIAEQDS